MAWLCLAASAFESFLAYPHCLSFFNLLIGGPAHGHEWLLDSNVAWGQDLIFLKEWIDRHPEAQPLHLATVGWLDPQVLGIEYTIPPVGPFQPISAPIPERGAVTAVGPGSDSAVPQTWDDVHSPDDLGPQPGWYIVDVDHLHATAWPANRPGWLFQKIAEKELNYEYFRLFKPCSRIAYSYFVYHLTSDDANRVRGELNLPMSPAGDDD